MSKVLIRLAFNTLRKNGKIVLPFSAGSILMTMMLYSITALPDNPGMKDLGGAGPLSEMLGFGQGILMFFILIFFFYLNGVLQREFQKESGLYTVLGMGKVQLVELYFFRMIMLLIPCTAAGLIAGIGFDKLMFLLLGRVLNMPLTFGFHVSVEAMIETSGYIAAVYLILTIVSCFGILRSRPVEMLRYSDEAQTEPKARFILAAAGVVCLGIGYWLALTITDPIETLALFFVAVAFVIAGTYLLFLCGLNALLKLLQKNRKYYYSSKHFVSLSFMKYRLKQNAMSLANIAILSTMILVALSTSLTLMATLKGGIDEQFPREMALTFTSFTGGDPQEVLKETELKLKDSYDNVIWYRQKSLNTNVNGTQSTLYLVPLSDYNRITGAEISVDRGQAALWYTDDLSDQTEIEAAGIPFQVVESLKEKSGLAVNKAILGNAGRANSLLAVVADEDFTKAAPDSETNGYFLADPVNLSSDASSQVYEEAAADVYEKLGYDWENPETLPFEWASVSFKSATYRDALTLYSGVLFIGIYVSIMFLMAVVLIMYYKQISEGLEDQKRYKTLKDVGLEPRQIKKIINDQVLLMFFMPLLTALIHTVFASKMINNLLLLAPGATGSAFLPIVGITLLGFGIIYSVFYKLTTRVYYSIVR